MLGLMSTTQFSSEFSLTHRRRVFYEYPNGAAPLMGLLSICEPEVTDKPVFGWYEDRMADQKTTTVGISAGNGPFSLEGSDTPATAAGFAVTAGQVIRVRVTSSAQFKPNHVMWIRNVKIDNTPTVTDSFIGIVTDIISSVKIEIRMLEAAANVENGDGTGGTQDQTGLTVLVIGTANAEGSRSGQGIWTAPRSTSNYTQIFRSPFSFTRTALKAGVKWDKTGTYRDALHKTGLFHMVEMEKAAILGVPTETTVENEDGEQVPVRTTGGILHYLRLWEAGTTYGNTAATTNDQINKRILKINGSISKATWNTYMSRAFRVTNNKDWSKLVLCGGGFLEVVNAAYEKQITVMAPQKGGGDTYGMRIHVLETVSGTLYFKTHPLFNQISDFYYSALILDVHNLVYHPLQDSDTKLFKNRQLPDADRRKDEWLTEMGLEVRFPESHMFIDNLTGITS